MRLFSECSTSSKQKMLGPTYSDAGICCSGTPFLLPLTPQLYIPSVLWKTKRENTLANEKTQKVFQFKPLFETKSNM